MQKYIAHISDDGREQTVSEHNQNVAELAASFAESFNESAAAYQIGLAHDIGKQSEEFQNRILHNGPKCDHSTAGAYELRKAQDTIGAFAVAGHHSGLPDLGGRADDASEPTMQGRIKRAENRQIPKYVCDVSFDKRADIRLDFETSFKIRMLYSCLVDADYLDTELFMRNDERLFDYDSIDILLTRFNQYNISKWSEPKSDLDKIRLDILHNCLDKGSIDKGLYSLTVPTGGGKTTASLGFALTHAQKHHMQRVIYIVPYTSIIEQNAQVFRNILGTKNVLEHHAGYDGHNSEEFDKEQLAAENWDAPVIVTTAVRFFEALYAHKPSRCRKLHNIANSVLIFDEAQLIPAEHLIPCTKAINELVQHYNCTAVFCTATCPDLRRFFNDLQITELQEDKKPLYESLRRTHIEVLDGKYGSEEIAEMMSLHNQVLCVVNTRKAAKDIYKSLPENGRYHLSTLMYPVHRRKVLDEIRRRLLDGKTVRLVSTSLIEAGVDVDFPAVLREYAGLDSVLQASGRCNRENKRSIEDSPVYIFERHGRVPPMLSRTISALRETMMGHMSDLDSLDAVNAYFQSLYRLIGQENMDKCDAFRAFDQCRPCPFPFRTVGESFHIIDDNTVTVYIQNDDTKLLIDCVRVGCADRETYRELGQYSLSLYYHDFEKLCNQGDIEVIGEHFAVMVRPVMYSEETGLSLDQDGCQLNYRKDDV